FEQRLARQGVAVTVQTAGRKTDQNIARTYRSRVDDFLFLQDTDDEAREIVFALGKIARMLCSFSADKRAACFTATGRDAAHHRLSDFDIELAANEIIQEKKRRRALSQDVVHSHGDEIDADGI